MNVVICDDDPVSRMAMVDLMKRFPGLEVAEASDGEEAWTLLQESVPLMCCTGLRLPGLSGIDLLRRARQTRPLHKLPFVMMAPGLDAEGEAEAMRFGAIDCLHQPIELQQAHEHMAGLLQRVWAITVEESSITLKRLQVRPDQLDRDYHTFERQIDKVSAELAAVGGKPDAGVLRPRLQGLVDACIALGLWRGEDALQGLLAAPAAKVQMFGVLNSIRAMIRHQLESLHCT